MDVTKVRIFKERVLAWSARLRVRPKHVHVRPMIRKWGSCSTQGRVTFALDLLGRDARSQDFVIVHELLHLRLRRHGKLFRAYLQRYVPGWRGITHSLGCADGLRR